MNIVNTSKSYNKTSSLVYSCQYHCIFCPKYRRKVLTGDVEKRLRELITEYSQELGFTIIEYEIMPDHVHLLIDSCPSQSILTIVNLIKGKSSRTLREEFPYLKSKLPTMWSRMKFISSVGSVTIEIVKKYIEDQKGV